MSPRVLLLDLYEARTKPYIQPYLHLGAFLGSLGVAWDVFRWTGDADAVSQRVAAGRFTHVFVNAVCGPMLALVEAALAAAKRGGPVETWVGGPAVHFLPELLAASPSVDRVSRGHPRADPDSFTRELLAGSLLSELPPTPSRFPSLLANERLPAFLHEHIDRERGGHAVSLNTTSAGGCPSRCVFCYLARAPAWAQPIEALVADLARLVERYGLRYVELSDDNFAADVGRVGRFAAALEQADLDLAFFCLSSIETLDVERLDLLCGAGLAHLFVGVDAIAPRHLKALGKPYGRPELDTALARLSAYPIDIYLSLVIGNPGETRAELEELLAWSQEVAPPVVFLNFLTPYPGTPAFRERVARGGLEAPTTLEGWAELCRLGRPKGWPGAVIDLDEYEDWKGRFREVATREFRSAIGASVRRTAATPARFPELE